MDADQKLGLSVAVVFLVAILGALQLASFLDPAEMHTATIRGQHTNVAVHLNRQAIEYGCPCMVTEVRKKEGKLVACTRICFPRRGIVSSYRNVTKEESNLFYVFYR